MNADSMLVGLGLIETAQKLGTDGVNTVTDLLALTGARCESLEVALYLAGVIAGMAEQTGFKLGEMVAHERAEALAHHDPGGMA